MAITDYLALMSQRVQDTDQRLTEADHARALRSAITKYSQDCPRLQVVDVVSAGGAILPLPATFDAANDTLTAIEYPIGFFPPRHIEPVNYQLLQTPSGFDLRLCESLGVDEHMRIVYATSHVVDALNDSIPTKHLDAVADWAASLLCHDLATLYSADSEPTIGADAITHSNKASAFAARSRTLAQRYYDALGIDPKRNNAAGEVVNLSVTPSHGAPWLTHRRGFYRG